jgi:hypothetical protein
MTAKMSPATMADKPAQRMRFEGVIFILLSVMTAVWRLVLVFMWLSPSIVAVFATEFML